MKMCALVAPGRMSVKPDQGPWPGGRDMHPKRRRIGGDARRMPDRTVGGKEDGGSMGYFAGANRVFAQIPIIVWGVMIVERKNVLAG